MESKLEYVLDALNEIGIKSRITPGANGFVKNIEIKNGVIHVDEGCLLADILHEAGHLAILPKEYREHVNGSVTKTQKKMLDDLAERNVDPESEIFIAAMQTSDCEATAWAWAFGKHLNLDDDEIIIDDSYHNENGEPGGSVVRLMLQMNQYLGINGLSRAGFCSVNKFGKLPIYPKLAFWTQKASMLN